MVFVFSYLSTTSEWPSTHVAHVMHVLTQISAMCSKVDYLYIRVIDHSGWRDDIDNAEWLALFQLLTDVETLRVYGRMAGQVTRALEDVTGEMVTEVLPSLHLLIYQDPEELVSAQQFVFLRQLYGCPVTIREAHDEYDESL